MSKELLKAAWIRAVRTFLQSLVMTLPTGTVITPAMVEHFDKGLLYTVLAWLAAATLTALGSFLTCIVGGLPEVEDEAK